MGTLFDFLSPIFHTARGCTDGMQPFCNSLLNMSHLALMAMSNTSLSVHVFRKVTNVVTHRNLPQHLFSSSVGITRPMPHTHTNLVFLPGQVVLHHYHLHTLPNSWHNLCFPCQLLISSVEYCLFNLSIS